MAGLDFSIQASPLDFSQGAVAQTDPEAAPAPPVEEDQPVSLTESVGKLTNELTSVESLRKAFPLAKPEDIKAMANDVKVLGRLSPHLRRKLSQFDADVDYKTEVPNELRRSISRADTQAEKLNAINSFYGGKVGGTDSSGRLTYIHPFTGIKTAVDSPDINAKDLQDLAGVAPTLAGQIGAIALTKNPGPQVGSFVRNLWQLGAETLGTLVGFGAGEAYEQVNEENLEDLNEVVSRGEGEAALTVGGFFLGKAGGRLMSKLWAPFGGSATNEGVDIYRSMRELDEGLTRKGIRPVEDDVPIGPVNVPPSTLNTSPTIARFEGILSKLLISGALWKKEAAQLNTAVKAEVDDLVRQGFIPFEDGPKTQELMRRGLVNHRNSMLSEHNARWSGLDPATGGQVVRTGTEAALENFQTQASLWRTGLGEKVAGMRIFDGQEFKSTLSDMLNRQDVRDEFLKTIPAERVAQLQKWSELPQQMTLNEAQLIREELGNMMRGTDPIAKISEGVAKRVYGALSRDMERVSPVDVVIAQNRPLLSGNLAEGRRFAKEWVDEFKQFNNFYKSNHTTFNDKKSPLNKILRTMEPSNMVSTFFRKGQVDAVKDIKGAIDKDSFASFQNAAQEMILNPIHSGKKMNGMMDKMGDDMLFETFGAERTASIRNTANSINKLENTPVTRYLKDSQDGAKLFNSFVPKNNEIGGMLQARKLLGPGSQEWAKLQTAYTKSVIDAATETSGDLSGKRLLTEIEKRGSKEMATVLGKEPVDRMKRLGFILRATQKSEGGGAGGLASSFILFEMLRGNLFHAFGTGVAAWLTSRMMLSRGFDAWITNKPLGNLPKSGYRAFSQTVLRLANEGATDVDELEGEFTGEAPGLQPKGSFFRGKDPSPRPANVAGTRQ